MDSTRRDRYPAPMCNLYSLTRGHPALQTRIDRVVDQMGPRCNERADAIACAAFEALRLKWPSAPTFGTGDEAEGEAGGSSDDQLQVTGYQVQGISTKFDKGLSR